CALNPRSSGEQVGLPAVGAGAGAFRTLDETVVLGSHGGGAEALAEDVEPVAGGDLGAIGAHGGKLAFGGGRVAVGAGGHLVVGGAGRQCRVGGHASGGVVGGAGEGDEALGEYASGHGGPVARADVVGRAEFGAPAGVGREVGGAHGDA